MTTLIEGHSRNDVWDGTVIDCDVHANVPSLETLFEYQDDLWVQWARERDWQGPVGPGLAYPPNAPTTVRPEWRPRDGRAPASDVSLVQEHLLDPWRTERAVINCYYGIDSVRHPDWAAALASAVNDWLIDQWLDRDKRLAASLVLPGRDPIAAAREIERVGHHPGFVQVLLPVRSDRLYGQRSYHPLFEAAARNKLVVGLHWGGTTDDAPSPSGFASWYAEEMAAEIQVYLAQITSMITEGLFQLCPDLRITVLDSGFTWIPTWGWSLNKKWKALRREVPWLDRPPLDVFRDHFRVSTTPGDLGPSRYVETIINWIGTPMLMFGSDYPHLHVDDITSLLNATAAGDRAAMMADTARSWYRLGE